MVLEEEQVDALIAVADKQGITLSAVFRDIVASYMGEYAAMERACLWALRRQFYGAKVTVEAEEQDETKQSDMQNEMQNLRDEIASLRNLITDHLAHHATVGHVQQSIPTILFEDVQVSPPVAIDETVLAKNREPVAPVIEAPTYGSFQEIEDDKEYSVDEVSAYLGLSPATIRKYARDGRISAQKVHRAYVFLGKDIREYLRTFSRAKG